MRSGTRRAPHMAIPSTASTTRPTQREPIRRSLSRRSRAMRKALVLVLLLAGCATPPPVQPPKVELPKAWKETAPRYAEDGRWWRIYQDAELEKLIDEALTKNSDLL